MSNNSDKTHYEKYLEESVTPTKPTARQIKLARDRFSSRAEPPKS